MNLNLRIDKIDLIAGVDHNFKLYKKMLEKSEIKKACIYLHNALKLSAARAHLLSKDNPVEKVEAYAKTAQLAYIGGDISKGHYFIDECLRPDLKGVITSFCENVRKNPPRASYEFANTFITDFSLKHRKYEIGDITLTSNIDFKCVDGKRNCIIIDVDYAVCLGGSTSDTNIHYLINARKNILEPDAFMDLHGVRLNHDFTFAPIEGTIK